MGFYENFSELCKGCNVSIAQVIRQIGLSNSVATYWKRGSVPSGETLQKLGDYFGVTVDYLLGNEKRIEEAAPSDVTQKLLRLIDQMSEEDLKFILRLASSMLKDSGDPPPGES